MFELIIALLTIGMFVLVGMLVYNCFYGYTVFTKGIPCDEPLHNHHDGCPKCDYPYNTEFGNSLSNDEIDNRDISIKNRDEVYCTDEELISIKKYAREIAHNAMLMDGNHDNWHEEDVIRSYMDKMTVLLNGINYEYKHHEFSGG
jgi:hypothetical protein